MDEKSLSGNVLVLGSEFIDKIFEYITLYDLVGHDIFEGSLSEMFSKVMPELCNISKQYIAEGSFGAVAKGEYEGTPVYALYKSSNIIKGQRLLVTPIIFKCMGLTTSPFQRFQTITRGNMREYIIPDPLNELFMSSIVSKLYDLGYMPTGMKSFVGQNCEVNCNGRLGKSIYVIYEKLDISLNEIIALRTPFLPNMIAPTGTIDRSRARQFIHSMYFPLLHGLRNMERSGLQHLDLHAANIMIKWMDTGYGGFVKNDSILYQIYQSNDWVDIPTLGFLPKFADYGSVAYKRVGSDTQYTVFRSDQSETIETMLDSMRNYIPNGVIPGKHREDGSVFFMMINLLYTIHYRLISMGQRIESQILKVLWEEALNIFDTIMKGEISKYMFDDRQHGALSLNGRSYSQNILKWWNRDVWYFFDRNIGQGKFTLNEIIDNYASLLAREGYYRGNHKNPQQTLHIPRLEYLYVKPNRSKTDFAQKVPAIKCQSSPNPRDIKKCILGGRDQMALATVTTRLLTNYIPYDRHTRFLWDNMSRTLSNIHASKLFRDLYHTKDLSRIGANIVTLSYDTSRDASGVFTTNTKYVKFHVTRYDNSKSAFLVTSRDRGLPADKAMNLRKIMGARTRISDQALAINCGNFITQINTVGQDVNTTLQEHLYQPMGYYCTRYEGCKDLFPILTEYSYGVAVVIIKDYKISIMKYIDFMNLHETRQVQYFKLRDDGTTTTNTLNMIKIENGRGILKPGIKPFYDECFVSGMILIMDGKHIDRNVTTFAFSDDQGPYRLTKYATNDFGFSSTPDEEVFPFNMRNITHPLPRNIICQSDDDTIYFLSFEGQGNMAQGLDIFQMEYICNKLGFKTSVSLSGIGQNMVFQDGVNMPMWLLPEKEHKPIGMGLVITENPLLGDEDAPY